jgi:hypothetical protein
MPILPLMEGLLPGSPRVYRKFTDEGARSVIHLHHFLHYAETMARLFDSQGFRTFDAVERDEMMTFLEDGKAHYRKPIGVWATRGWDVSSLLHVDDSTKVVADLPRQGALKGFHNLRALHVPHPHSTLFKNVQEWHKISLPSLWRKREDAMHGVIRHLARVEWSGSTIVPLLGALGVFDAAGWPSTGLPEGTVLTVHETPTTLVEFYDFYVEPTNRAAGLIREARDHHGGLKAVRRAHRAADSLASLAP